MVGFLHRPSDKPGFIEYLQNSLKESNIFNIQKYCLKGDFNINLLRGSSMLLDNKYYHSFSQVLPLDKNDMDLCFSHSLHQFTAEPTRTTKLIKTLIDHIFTTLQNRWFRVALLIGTFQLWANLLRRKNVIIEIKWTLQDLTKVNEKLHR